MKIAIRMLVFAGLLVAGISLTGPGTPVEPPVAVVL